jgi:hypothetical protein
MPRWLNGFCDVVAVAATGGVGYLAWMQKRASEWIPISSKAEAHRQICRRNRKQYAAAEKL